MLVVDMESRTVFDEPVGGHMDDRGADTKPVSFEGFIDREQAKMETA